MGPTRKIIIFLIVLLGLIIAAPYVIPLNLFFTDRIEKSLSEKLKRKVSISDMGFAYRPYPTLILEDVQIGSGAQDGTVQSVELQLDLLTAFSSQKRLRSFIAKEGSFTHLFIQQVPDLLKPSPGGSGYFIRTIELSKSTIRTPNGRYGPLEAEVFLNPDQSFKRVLVHDEQGSVTLEVRPNKDHFSVSVSAKNWEAMIKGKKSLLVESLVVEADTHGNSVLAHEVKGNFARGRFKGSAVLDWSQGWSLTGNFEIDGMNGDTLTSWFSPKTYLTGKVDGVVETALNGDSFDTLVGSPQTLVKANFTSTAGTLNNFDFVSPVRINASSSGISGGSTKYDSLKGNLVFRRGQLALSGMQLKSGLLTVTANMSVNGEKLGGAANVTLGQGSNRRSVPLRITGDLERPRLIPPSSSGGESSVTVITE